MQDRDRLFAVARTRWRVRLRVMTRNGWMRAIAGMAAMGLLALLYLNQVAAVATANSQLGALRAEQSHLQNEDARLKVQLGTVTSPAWIDRQARALGLTPAAPGTVRYLTASAARSSAGGQP